jgi:hypothetical protein
MKVGPSALFVATVIAGAGLVTAATTSRAAVDGAPTLESAQRLFYTSRFHASAEEAKRVAEASPTDLAAWEIRTSALHFQIKRASGEGKDRKVAMAACQACPALLEVFLAEIKRGKAAAKAQLVASPNDIQAMYYLAKIDLSYLWMQLSTLGKRTGWDEYWEAKRLLEVVLAKEPSHVRAQVARAWMDYIVGSRVPWGTRWVMGGGNRDRGLSAMRAAAVASGDFYTEVEADFGLWEMLVREGKRAEAVPIARTLLTKFPDNEEIAKFVSGS